MQKYAKKEVKNQVIRADQLIAFIKNANAEPESTNLSEKDMMAFAQYFLKESKENPTDYLAKYKEVLEIAPEEELEKEINTPAPDPEQMVCPRCGAAMVKRVATKGANAGKEFWGCSNFPKCRMIINIK